MTRIRAIVLLLAIAGSMGLRPAVAGPCQDDATVCVPGTDAAACRSIPLLFTGDRTAVAEAAVSMASAPAAEYARGDVATVRRQTPLGIVEASGVHATCQAYSVPPSHAGRKACGRADIEDVMIDLTATAGAVLTARGVLEDGCTGVGAGAGSPFNDARIAQVTLHVGGGTGPVDLATQPNTIVPLPGGITVFVNEAEVIPGACLRNAGAALRVAGPAGSIVLGWVATSACA